MRIIAVVNRKGGMGKTTLTGHLAVEAERQGAGPVALIDTDEQGSLAAWWNVRKAETPLFVRGALTTLHGQLDQLAGAGIGVVLIDTPPMLTENVDQVVREADLVVMSTRSSPHDLRAVGATVDLVERTGKPMLFIVNGATNRARITGDAAIALSQHGTVAPVTVHQRVDFAVSMIDVSDDINPRINDAHCTECRSFRHPRQVIVVGWPGRAVMNAFGGEVG